jgi:hypothetical protein
MASQTSPGKLRALMRASTVISAGAYILMIMMPIVIGVEACLMIGMPMGPGNMIAKLFYWTLVFMIAVPTMGNVMFSMAVGGALKGAIVGAIIFYIISIAWRIFVIVYLALILATCEGDVSCADNIDCAGTLTGVYGGPSARYLGLFIMAIITFLVHVAAILICFSTRWAIVRHEPGFVKDPYSNVSKQDRDDDAEDGTNVRAVGGRYHHHQQQQQQSVLSRGYYSRQ